MVEVFKTNVKDKELADTLLDLIHNTYNEYKANFDMEDCENILRIECSKGIIKYDTLLTLLKENGCVAEILSD